MKVFIYKNRGVVVNNPSGFQEKRPDLLAKDYEDCRDIQIKQCTFTMNGMDGWAWATLWLQGKAGDRLTTIPCQSTVRECGFTLKEIIKSKIATEGRAHKNKSRTSQRHVGQQF